MAVEYIVYCDELESRGRHFSNFYGGALVSSEHIEEVRTVLAAKKQALNLFGEVKWSKITVNYHKKYIDLIDCFFDLVAAGKVKIRIMFTQNIFRARRGLSRNQIDNQYTILYYYFIRHAFGLIHCPHSLAVPRCASIWMKCRCRRLNSGPFRTTSSGSLDGPNFGIKASNF